MVPRHLLISCLGVSFVAMTFAGCLDDPSPVYVPRSALADEWTHETNNKTESEAGGSLEIVINHYAYSGQLVGEIMLAGVTDVPFVDEVDELENHLDGQVSSSDVDMTKTGERDMTLDNGQKVKLREYDISKRTATGEARGKAWIITWDDGDFIGAGLGYATTEYSGLIGSTSDETQWRNVQAMMRAADW